MALGVIGDAAVAFGLTSISEVGDKSQLLLVALAARRPRVPVAVGGLAGIAGVQLVAVAVGGWLAISPITRYLPLVVGVMFVGFGGITLLGSDPVATKGSDPNAALAGGGGSVLVTSAGLLFLAELGDKTMFASAGLAAVRSPVGVFVGATAAFAVLTVLAVLVGSALAERLPERALRLVSGVVMIGVGLVVLALEFAS